MECNLTVPFLLAIVLHHWMVFVEVSQRLVKQIVIMRILQTITCTYIIAFESSTAPQIKTIYCMYYT